MILPLVTLIAGSAYGLQLSYANITRLQQYEEQSEKAAEWSNKAAQRLHKTRTTQTSGTVTLIVSLATALTLLLRTSSKTTLLLAAGANAVALFASRTHMANFWNESNQVKLPFVGKFNEAIKGSEQVVGVLGMLSVVWGMVGVAWLFGFTGL